MNLVNVSYSQLLALWGIKKNENSCYTENNNKREVQSSFLSLPSFFFFFLKLGVIHFREHKVYILTETVQKLPGPQKQLAR